MKRSGRLFASISLALFVCMTTAFSAAQLDERSFPPFLLWKAAILEGNADALRGMYSTDPPVQVEISRVTHDANADIDFWLALKARSISVQVIRNEERHGHISFIFHAEVVSGLPNAQGASVTEDQAWKQQADGHWRLIGVERTDAPRLNQPANMKKDIYPANVDAHAEIREAEEKAAKEHKRLLLVFGANWCFDCHVLDLAFQRPDLAPIVDGNFEVVHIDLGLDEKKNADLVQQYQIPLDKGIPALAVAESDGKLVISQKNGEFEDARGLTPEALAEFLNKWKPGM